MILINSVHLDAVWSSPFEPESTEPGLSTHGDGSLIETAVVSQTLNARYVEEAGAQAIVLPYTDGYDMVVVLPADGDLGGFDEALVDADGDLGAVLKHFATPRWHSGCRRGTSRRRKIS